MIKLKELLIKLAPEVRKHYEQRFMSDYPYQSKGIFVAMSLPHLLIDLLLSPEPRAVHLKKRGIDWPEAEQFLDGHARSVVLQGALKNAVRIEAVIEDEAPQIWRLKIKFFEQKKQCGLDLCLYIDKDIGVVFSGGITLH
jgi:hypothetical protein